MDKQSTDIYLLIIHVAIYTNGIRRAVRSLIANLLGSFYPYCRQATLLHLLPTSYTPIPATAKPYLCGRRLQPGELHYPPQSNWIYKI